MNGTRCQHCRNASATVAVRDVLYGLVGEYCLRDGLAEMRKAAKRDGLPLRLMWVACGECGGEGRRSDGHPCNHCAISLGRMLEGVKRTC